MAAPHDLPSAAELVEAVRDWLELDVAEADRPPNRFHLRVATNMLAIAAREFELGEQQAADHAERLQRLGVGSDRELADAIRDGTIDYRDAELRAAVRASVRDKLLVANPKYLERRPG